MNNLDHHDIFISIDNRDENTSILSLPMDLRLSIIGYLRMKDMHSLIRTCKSNLYSCKQYIHSLLSIKFKYLLNQNKGKIKIKHLMNIPLVDSIIVNPLFLPIYIGVTNRTSAKYFGIDNKTGNGFISFWIRRIEIKRRPWRIITFVFNQTGIDCIYLSDSSRRLSFFSPIKLRPLNENGSSYYRLKVINELVSTGEKGMMCDDVLWHFNYHWESCLFWPRIRAKFRIV